jgi:hypothetical protein
MFQPGTDGFTHQNSGKRIHIECVSGETETPLFNDRLPGYDYHKQAILIQMNAVKNEALQCERDLSEK